MSLLQDFDTPRLTSSLNDVVNDTGRVAFCGPFVLSAITGYPVSSVENVATIMRRPTQIPANRLTVVGIRLMQLNLLKSQEPGINLANHQW